MRRINLAPIFHVGPLRESSTPPAVFANLQCFPQVWQSRLSFLLVPMFHVVSAPRVFHPTQPSLRTCAVFRRCGNLAFLSTWLPSSRWVRSASLPHHTSRLCEPALFSAGVAISPFSPPGSYLPRGVRSAGLQAHLRQPDVDGWYASIIATTLFGTRTPRHHDDHSSLAQMRYCISSWRTSVKMRVLCISA
jgi:hypothetical protein